MGALENFSGVRWAASAMRVSRKTALLRCCCVLLCIALCLFAVLADDLGLRHEVLAGRAAYASPMMMTERAMAADDPPRMRIASAHAAPMMSKGMPSLSDQAAENAQEDDLDIPSGKMLVKSGTVSLGVEEAYFATATQKIERVMVSVGGGKAYIESQSSGKGRLRMTLRVPVETFEDAMAALEGLVGAEGALGKSGDVYEASKDAKDVTAEFVDRSARKKALDGTHKQLLKLLERANTVSDVLQVQRELGRVAGDIESQAARLKHLKSTSAMSKITVTANIKYTPKPLRPIPWIPLNPSRALERATRALGKIIGLVVDGTVWIVVFCVPITIAICALYQVGRRAEPSRT